MHFDHDFARASGLGAPLAPGLLSAAWSLGALTLQAPSRLAIGAPAAFIAGYRVRFARSVKIGDRFSLRWNEGTGACVDGLSQSERRDTNFEILDQRDEVSSTGAVSVCLADAGGELPTVPDPPSLLEIEVCSAEPPPGPFFAEDVLEFGPRGESLGRTVTVADVVGYASFSGELNPAYLNQEFARTGRFGAQIAPPMWSFCLAFGDCLRELLALPLPSAGFAGHLGDSWRFLAPIHIGDTIRTRHKPVSCRPSRSRPEMAIVEFALQLLNQRDEIVQDGRVAMMIPAREGA